ncbi:hypothetical protein Ciccas_003283 [Cichlidogyrus casuarinus]|uniref:Uncharacterized protein n=1 Tax=Cichlidogyrus casuarinus TaxID=1844966 RepID=A0ABD2QI20_9PLAT
MRKSVPSLLSLPFRPNPYHQPPRWSTAPRQWTYPTYSPYDESTCSMASSVTESGLSIIFLYARSARNKAWQLHSNLATVGPDILAFTESWLNQANPNDQISFPQYSIYCSDRNASGGGGVGLFFPHSY